MDIVNAYNSIQIKNGTIPINKNTENLANAIESIESVITYTVAFNSDGGSTVEEQIIVNGQTAKKPNAPSKNGYRFKYWTLNNVEYNFDIPITDNITLTAVWEATRLPEEYTEVDYIESTGTQYIDTGFLTSPNTKVIADFQYMKLVNGERLFGRYLSYATSNDLSYDFYISSSLKFAYTYNNKQGNWTGIHLADLQRHKLIFNQNKKIILDDNEIQMQGEATYSCKRNFLIFSAYESTETQLNDAAYSYAKLYSFKMYDNDVLIRDFIPCYRKADNVPGLYESVNNKFYTNAGTGVFLFGNS